MSISTQIYQYIIEIPIFNAYIYVYIDQHDKLQSLRNENSQLQALTCKLKALNKWKITAKEGQLREKLRKAEKVCSKLNFQSPVLMDAFNVLIWWADNYIKETKVKKYIDCLK